MVSRSPSFGSKLSRISSRQYEHFDTRGHPKFGLFGGEKGSSSSTLNRSVSFRTIFESERRTERHADVELVSKRNESKENLPIDTLAFFSQNDSKSSQIARSVNASPLLGSNFVLEPAAR